MDVAAEAMTARTLTVLPESLDSRGRRRDGRVTIRVAPPAEPLTPQPTPPAPQGTPAPPPPATVAPPPAAVAPPAAPVAPRQPPATAAPPAAAPVPSAAALGSVNDALAQRELANVQRIRKGVDHVTRLSDEVRALRLAFDYVRTRLTTALEACAQEAARAAAAQNELATRHSSTSQLSEHTEQLKAALTGAQKQADDWSEQARRTELKLRTFALESGRAVEAANARVAEVTAQFAAHEAAVNQLRKTASEQRAELEKARAERDAARLRIAELEAAAERVRNRHPRGGLAAIAALPTQTPPPSARAPGGEPGQ